VLFRSLADAEARLPEADRSLDAQLASLGGTDEGSIRRRRYDAGVRAVFKQVDTCGGVVAARHARANVVTASIDRVDFHNPCYVGNLLVLKGSLNHVGRSSMEIGVRVEAENVITGERKHIASAYLTLVALDGNRRPMPVPQLLLETEDEKRRWREAEARRAQRLQERSKPDEK